MADTPGPELTQLMRAWSGGDNDAGDQLFESVYTQLHARAANLLRRERAGHTLQAADIVNGAYLQLAGLNDPDWENRHQFLGMAAVIMRRILIDHARSRLSAKRGGNWQRLTLTVSELSDESENIDVLALDQALNDLASKDARKAKLVELCYFAGLTVKEAAEVLGISLATAKRDWQFSRAWLFRHLTEL